MGAVAYTAPGRPRALSLLVAGVLLALLVAAAFGNGGPVPEGGSASPQVPADREETVEEAEELDELPADTLMVWAGARLGEGYADAVAEDPRVGVSVVVHGELLQLERTWTADGDVVDELPDGWWYPVEVLAVDPARYDEVAGRELLGELAEDEAVLSESSAEVRGLAPGDRLGFAGDVELTVVDVLPNRLVGAAEVLVHEDGPLEVETEKYLLVAGGDGDLEQVLEELATDEREPRVVAKGETPVLRHAHGVLPSVERKEHFGEFAMQDLSGRDIRPGQSWVDEHITVESVPIIGRVRCHEALIEPLRAAMEELQARGAEHVIDDYAGCWVPRRSGATGPLSSHAWGVSIDFNAEANPYSAEPDQPDVLVEVMAEHGFLWGGDWDVPDAMHFELAPGRDTAR
jgi:hypothetical protein